MAILDKEPIPVNYLESQRTTLENGLTIIEDVLAAGIVDKERIRRFGVDNAPGYLENAALTVSLELDVLHETVMKWKERVGPESWTHVYVVICGGHQARYREASLQYFQRLLHEKEDIEAGLDLLARHIIDQRASLDLFTDRSRLQQDLMSDGAAAYLNELLP